MAGAGLVDRLRQRFGDAVSGAELEVLDPWVEISPAGLVPVCEFLRDDPEWRLDMLNFPHSAMLKQRGMVIVIPRIRHLTGTLP